MDIADLIDSINERAGIIIFKTWGGKFYQNIKESYEVSFLFNFFFRTNKIFLKKKQFYVSAYVYLNNNHLLNYPYNYSGGS